MKEIFGLRYINLIPPQTLASIGIFDGVHRGHRVILKRLIKCARRLKAKTLVITFYPHPLRIINPRLCPPLLISLPHRLRLIEELGIDYCLIIKFNQRFANLTALEFVQKILAKLEIKTLFMGEDFHFGRAQEGNFSFLRDISKKMGFDVVKIPSQKFRNRTISSTWIRREIKRGNLAVVKKLLARDLSLYGRVVKGEGRGKVLGFPTANLDIEQEVIPPSGVYAVKILLKEKIFGGLLNIGIRPTFLRQSKAEAMTVAEVHILDFKGRLYGEFVEVILIKKLRPEKRFSSICQLISAMQKDEIQARRILAAK